MIYVSIRILRILFFYCDPNVDGSLDQVTVQLHQLSPRHSLPPYKLQMCNQFLFTYWLLIGFNLNLIDCNGVQ